VGAKKLIKSPSQLHSLPKRKRIEMSLQKSNKGKTRRKNSTIEASLSPLSVSKTTRSVSCGFAVTICRSCRSAFSGGGGRSSSRSSWFHCRE